MKDYAEGIYEIVHSDISFSRSSLIEDFKQRSVIIMMSTAIFRPDGIGDDRDRRSRRYNPRMSRMRTGNHRASKGSSGVKCGSVAAKRGGSGKFLLIGAVLAIQFIGAAAISSKGECFLFRVNVLFGVVEG